MEREEIKWREEDNVIYFSVTSDGTTGEGWVERLEAKGFRLDDDIKQLLCSSRFKPTNGVTTQVAVLKGELFANNKRYNKTVRAAARKRDLRKPNAEIACHILEKFSAKEIEEMGLWSILTMHNPIKEANGLPLLLTVRRGGRRCYLNGYLGSSDDRRRHGSGFAFEVSQSPSI